MKVNDAILNRLYRDTDSAVERRDLSFTRGIIAVSRLNYQIVTLRSEADSAVVLFADRAV